MAHEVTPRDYFSRQKRENWEKRDWVEQQLEEENEIIQKKEQKNCNSMREVETLMEEGECF